MPVAISSDVLVNSQTNMEQAPTEVTALRNGTAVVSWRDFAAGEQGLYDAKFRLIGADGQPVGGEVTVGQAFDVAVAGLTGGGFVAVWATKDGTSLVTKAQVYSATGSAVGEAQTLSTTENGGGFVLGFDVKQLEVVGLSDGGYAASWTVTSWSGGGTTSVSLGLAVGSSSGALETYTGLGVDSGKIPYTDPHPAMVELPGGKILLSWVAVEGGYPYSMARHFQVGRVFDLQGNPAGSRFEFPAAADGGFVGYSGLQMAALPTGDVAFIWKASPGEVWVQLYNATGLLNGNATGHSAAKLVTSSLGQGEPQLAVLPDGRFVVAYSEGDDPMAQVYTASGMADGVAFKLGIATAGTQDTMDIAVLPNGSLIAVWRDMSGVGGDSSGASVKAGMFVLGDGVQGTAGADALTTGAGGQVVAGLEGADTLNGGAGADTLAGGAGADRFVLTADGSLDRILDFSHAAGDTFDMRTAASAQGSGGLFILNAVSGQASWDPDSDAGAQAAIALGQLNVSSLVREDFATAFHPDGLRTLLANGGREDTVFDWGNQGFTYATATFDAQGRAESWFVQNDDGSTGNRWWDTLSNQGWSTRAADYDAQGRLTAYAVTYDVGNTEIFQFDVTGTKTWTRTVDQYDELGRYKMQAVAWDDGTAFERHIDTYDVHPWAYYIDNYKDGALLNHTFYKADGTVFVG